MDRFDYETPKEEEPAIIRAARIFDGAQRELLMLTQQRKKIDEEAKQAQQNMNEAAARMREMIDVPESKRLPNVDDVMSARRM